MSSSNSSNDAILVNQETTVMVGQGDDVSGGLEIHIHSPSTTGELGEIENQMLQYSRPKTFRKLSNSSSLISEIFRHPSACEDRLRVKIKRANDRDNSKELIEFLRTTSPPPQNRMPLLENHADLSRKKTRLPFWAICKRLKARKAKQKAKMQPASPPPRLLKLPDSAVAGRTVDGHRHIAISIPVEYAHLSDELKSSVPVRTLTSHLIAMDRVPARVSSARSNTTVPNPAKEETGPLASSGGQPSSDSRQTTGSHEGNAASNSLETPSAELGNIRPRTAEPLGAQQNLLGVSSTPRDDLAMGMHYPAHNHSFGYSVIGIHESPDGVSVRRHHHWSWPAESKLGLKHASTSESIVMNGTEAALANAMAVHCYSPRISMTGADYYSSLSELRRDQSMLAFQDMGMALTSDLRPQMSYHELINHGPDSSGSENGDIFRSLTFDLPPGYPFPLGPGGMHKPLTITEPQVKESLHPTPVMTVVDVKPSLSMESLGSNSSQILTPQLTRSSSPLSSFEDGETTPRATGRQPVHHPSIEQLLFTRHPHLVDIVSPSSNIRNSSPLLTIRDYKPVRGERKVRRSESHQALAKRYQELRETCDKEMNILLDRLERLENKNDWWLNSVVPMVESMTRRLTRVYDDDSLPLLAHERAKTRRQNQSNSCSDIADITSTTIYTPLDNTGTSHLPSEPYSSCPNFLPSLSNQPTHQQSEPYSHNQSMNLGPESSFESFDSFAMNRPITTSDTPPAREPSPYPYPYIYPGESHQEIYRQGGEEYHRDAHCSFGSGCSNDNDSLPQLDMGIPSSRDSRHGAAGYGHGMGLAVDRLPLRHGERGLLSSVSPVGHLNSIGGAYIPHPYRPSRPIFIHHEDNEGSGETVLDYAEQNEGGDQGRRQTEWVTLEPLMRGLMETTRLDLELGRDLDLGVSESA